MSNHLARLVDAATRASKAWFEVSSKLQAHDFEPDLASLEERELLSWAFLYELQLDVVKSDDPRHVFAPMLEYANGVAHPPRVGHLTADVTAVWTAAAECESPAARARLHDLLFCHGESDAGVRAQQAILAYLDMVDQDWEGLDLVAGLARAAVLARITKDATLEHDVRSRTLAYARLTLRRGDAPGISLRLVELLLPHVELRAEVDELIETSRRSHGGDPHLLDEILSWQEARASSAADRQRATADRVSNWVTAAQSSEPIVKVLFLERAAQLAEQLQDVSLRNEVRALLQQAGRADLGMRTISNDFTVPESAVQQFLRPVLEQDSWSKALQMYSQYPPATGDVEQAHAEIKELDRKYPLQALMSFVRFGSDGLPRWTPSSPEDALDARLSRHEELSIQLTSPLLAEGLYRIREIHGPVERDELFRHWSSRATMSRHISANLGTALDLYWRDEAAAAAAIAIPMIEALVRELLLKADKGIYEAQRKRSPGVYPGLGTLLGELRALGFDESWYRYIKTAFASAAGLNLRNELAHGFLAPQSHAVAAMAIHVCGHLSLMTPVPAP